MLGGPEDCYRCKRCEAPLVPEEPERTRCILKYEDCACTDTYDDEGKCVKDKCQEFEIRDPKNKKKCVPRVCGNAYRYLIKEKCYRCEPCQVGYEQDP